MMLKGAAKDAKIAGLEVLRIINEPTAASLAYGQMQTKRLLLTTLVAEHLMSRF